ncbi:MAG: stalk domain-containing protein [Armatimonadota bacterium]
MRASYRIALSATVLLAVSSLPAAAQIGVTVNGTPVQFGAVAPARVSGRVLIPLRAVVESLGADVKWEPATRTVRGSKGRLEFTLQIDSRGATVNGSPVMLDVPAQLVQGTTMVPLRFVAEALGAEVEWNAAAQQVVIHSEDDGAPADPRLLDGEVVAIRPNADPPTVTIRSEGLRRTYEVPRDAVVLRGAAGERAQRVELGELQVGDPVRLRVTQDGRAIDLLEAQVAARPDDHPPAAEGPIEGEVIGVETRGGVSRLTLRTATGRVAYEVPANAIITRAQGGGRAFRSEFQDLEVGDRVRISTDAAGRVVRSVEATARGTAEIPVVNGRVAGEVVAVQPDGRRPTITVKSGDNRSTYELSADTVVFRAQGQERAVRSTAEELEPGDKVTIRVNQRGTVAEVVDAVAAVDTPDDLPVVSRDLRITSFTHSARGGTLRRGEELTLTLVGTPKATATAEVGPLGKVVTLREDPQRPGRYTGTVTVPANITAKDVNVIGQLRQGNRIAPLIQAAEALTVDSEPPALTAPAPASQAETRNQQPDIYLELSDAAGAGIDERSVRMTVRGKDVTEDVKITPRFLLYTPKTLLTPGPVPVAVSVKDMAGNENQITWTFNVLPAPEGLKSVTHDAETALRAGDVVTVTARGVAKGRATFSIGELATGVRMTESTPGVYVGKYTVKQGDQVEKAPIVVQFTTPDGNQQRGEATAPVNIVTRGPETPEITSPRRRFRLGNELVIQGNAAPGAKVVVEVTYSGRAFGALPVDGSLGTQEVTADRDGRWTTEPLDVRLPLGVKTPDLTIRAVTVDAAGTRSDPAEVQIRTR